MKLNVKKWAVCSVLPLLGCAAIYQGIQLHQLSVTADSNPLVTTVETLVEQQNTLRAEMDGFASVNFVTAAQHELHKAEMNQRIDSATQQDQPNLEWRALREEVTTLSADAQAMRESLQQLKLLVDQRPTSAMTIKPVARKTSTNTRPKPAPFKTISVEYRGGDQLLAVAPLSSNHLSEIQLLGVGDTMQGWQLQSLESGTAHFILPNGIRQTVTVK
jgi:outer membrane murein-binding lipoprotein Lpp